jgi:flavin reductase (DIM6/NTAB) family NADH-FMN oxidoreductase RutF
LFIFQITAWKQTDKTEENMEEISIGTAQKLSSPNPFGLVSSTKPDGSTNLMAISWWTYASNHPATILICLSNKGFSTECIKNRKEFGLSIVSESLETAAFQCGTCSGRDRDKATEFGIELIPGKTISAKLVADSRIVFECQLENFYQVGDHTVFVGIVQHIFADQNKKALYAVNGYGALKTVG